MNVFEIDTCNSSAVFTSDIIPAEGILVSDLAGLIGLFLPP
jgi:hypothetical protein